MHVGLSSHNHNDSAIMPEYMKLLIDQTTLNKVCEENAISYLAVFGSHARGDETKNSDIDLLVDYSTSKSMFDHVRTQRKLKEILGREVDLVTRKSLSPYISDYVNKDLKVLYAKR